MTVKVLHVIPSLSPKRGGPSVAVRRMTEGVAALGAEVHIAATDDDGRGHLGVPLGQPLRMGNVTTWHFRRQSDFYAFSWPLTRWLAAHVADYDILHLHALFSYAPVPAAFYARRAAVPYIVRPLGTLNRYGITQRRPWLKQISLRFIERPLLDRAACIHFTSRQEQIEAKASGIKGPSVVLPLGIDLSTYTSVVPSDAFSHRFPQTRGKRVVLFLSRLDPIKGLDLLLPAFQRAYQRFPDAMLVLVGSGEPSFEATLRSTAATLGIEEAVCWAGFLDGEAKREALAAAHCFVLPSYSESFGVAVVEALAAGLPVIVSDQVAIHREIANAEAGIVVPCTVDALAAAIERTLSEPDVRTKRAQAARQLAVSNFSVEHMATALVALYEEVIARADQPRAVPR